MQGLDPRQDQFGHRGGVGGLEPDARSLIPSRLVLGPDLEFKAGPFGHPAQPHALDAAIAFDERVGGSDLGDELGCLRGEDLRA